MANLKIHLQNDGRLNHCSYSSELRGPRTTKIGNKENQKREEDHARSIVILVSAMTVVLFVYIRAESNVPS